MTRTKIRVKSYFTFVLVVSGVLILLSVASIGLKGKQIVESSKTTSDTKCTCKSLPDTHVHTANITNTAQVVTSPLTVKIRSNFTNIHRLIESSSKNLNFPKMSKDNQSTDTISTGARYPDNSFANRSEILLNIAKTRQAIAKTKSLVNQLLNRTVREEPEPGQIKFDKVNPKINIQHLNSFNNTDQGSKGLVKSTFKKNHADIAIETITRFQTTVATPSQGNQLNKHITQKSPEDAGIENRHLSNTDIDKSNKLKFQTDQSVQDGSLAGEDMANVGKLSKNEKLHMFQYDDKDVDNTRKNPSTSNTDRPHGAITIINRPKLEELTKLFLDKRQSTIPLIHETTTNFKSSTPVSVNIEEEKPVPIAKDKPTVYELGGNNHEYHRNITTNTVYVKHDKHSNKHPVVSIPHKTLSTKTENGTKSEIIRFKTPYASYKNLISVKNMDQLISEHLQKYHKLQKLNELQTKPVQKRNFMEWTSVSKTLNVTPIQVNMITSFKPLPTRKDTCDSCFQNNFPILLNSKTVCNNSPTIDMLILIASSPDEKVKRNQIRKTWGTKCNHVYSIIKCVFLIGNFRKQSTRDNNEQEVSHGFGSIKTQRRLEIERNIHHDMVQFDFVDSYGNLTYKTLSGLKWAETFCPAAKYVMKTDTDMFVNTYLLHFLVQQAPQTLFMGGYCWGESSPHRDPASKWFVSYAQFRHHVFPAMCSGTGYILSADLVSLILKRSRSIPFFYLEDVYISLCLKGTGIKPKRLAGFFNEEEQFEACHYKTEVFTSHLVYPEMLQQYWNDAMLCNMGVLTHKVYREIPYPEVF